MRDTVPSDQTIIGDGETPEDRFASAWRDGSPPPPLTEFLPREGDEGYLATLERLIQVEIEQSWRRSLSEPSAHPQWLEDYLARFPALRTPAAIVRLAQVEFVARTRFGDPPAADSYVARFPDYVTPGVAEEFVTAAANSHSPREQASTAENLGALGDYKLLDRIGEGGMGIVYRAVQPGADRVVALKVIRSSVTSAGEVFRRKAETRFRNEIHAAARLEHENIIPVYDVGMVGELMYFAMRFVDGRSLNELVKQGPLENRQAATWMAGVARGVAEAHRCGILHRDLKPHNVMIDARTDQPMVADFGLAKLLDTDDQLTKTGETIGTPSYMPPEQISDASNVDARGDVYSLGATLYHLLSGRPPFQAANTLGTMRQVLYDEAVPPKRLNSLVDADLETISLKCLQKEPVRRYQSAREFLDDLERYLRGEPILARPIGRIERLDRWRRRNPVEAGLTAAAIVLAGAALAATTIGYRNTKAALAEAEQNLAMAKSAVDGLYTEVSEIDLQNQPGLQPLKQTLLVKALDYYRRLLERNRRDPRLTSEMADSHFRVGTITEEVKSVSEALPHYQAAADIQRSLLQKTPDDVAVAERLSDSLNALGRGHQRLEKFDDAQAAFEESRTLREKLATSSPGDREYQRKLANAIMNSGLLKARRSHLDGAAADYARAQSIRESLLDQSIDEAVARDFARGAYNQGALARQREQLGDATGKLQTAIKWFGKLVVEHPENLSDRFQLAVASVLHGDLLALQNDHAGAFVAYAASRDVLQKLVSENPQVVIYRERFATQTIGEARLRIRLATEEIEKNSGDAANAEMHLTTTETLLASGASALAGAIASEPERAGPRHDLAVICQLEGEIQLLRMDVPGAKAAWQRGLDTLAPLKSQFDRNPDCELQWETLQECLKLLGETSEPPAQKPDF
ncbi:Serine/threonine-protein kinase PknB [Caulifigura coniformis]|uniref:Serine/threonine-protein kinase PknB n=1 Tax=Caulifigura coniformis TaxID=2527983 RepID=A0A517SJH1_9PLAN|nr:serine/threonine-protein kinase [Caulifigura coniformis]QDT56246.1 Serine/threonine-protein kinase PknB [Caulifigura coniformis]